MCANSKMTIILETDGVPKHSHMSELSIPDSMGKGIVTGPWNKWFQNRQLAPILLAIQIIYRVWIILYTYTNM